MHRFITTDDKAHWFELKETELGRIIGAWDRYSGTEEVNKIQIIVDDELRDTWSPWKIDCADSVDILLRNYEKPGYCLANPTGCAIEGHPKLTQLQMYNIKCDKPHKCIKRCQNPWQYIYGLI